MDHGSAVCPSQEICTFCSHVPKDASKDAEEGLRRTASAVEREQVIGSLTRQIREYLQITEAELRCRTLRRAVVDARAVFAHTLVRYHGFSLTVVGRYLNLSPQAVARGVRRGEVVLVSRGLNPEAFLSR